jgi:hypothetical protein
VSEYVPKLLGQALRQGRVDLLALALELAVLPISLQVMVTLAIAALCLDAALAGLSWLPAYLALGGSTRSQHRGQSGLGRLRTQRSLPKDLLTVPLYVLNKIPLYFKFLVKPEKTWVRTERDG